MKSSNLTQNLFLAIVFFVLFGCTKKEADNPFDAGCPKEIFTPANIKSEMSGTSIKLSWTQENQTISGFVINRSEGGGTTAEVARVDKALTSWTDSKVAGGIKYEYTLYAYAGANLSNPLTSSVTTPALGATVTTVSAASNITPNSVVLGGNVTDDGGSAVTERGICYSTSQTPTVTGNKIVIGNGKGIFSNTVTGLAANTTYYVRAYATNSYGTTYGSEISFTTTQLVVPTLITTVAVSISASGAVLGGNVTSDGNSPVIETGVCYGITENPTTANSKVTIGTGTGVFSKAVTGLTEGTQYYARAFATNSIGTSYGTQISFTTTPLLIATVTTSVASTVTGTSAMLGGNVTNDGNATVTERGVCYATTPAPTTSGTKLAIGTGTGAFTNTVTGLTDGTKYYVRAYAINSKGTAYGDEISFTTTQSLPATVTTSAAATVTGTSAVLGGNVTNDGNATVTERGVCYATTQAPTTSGTKLVIGTGTGTFSNTVTGLTDGTKYYARAYAINSKGTAYGDEINFTTTQISLPTITTAVAGNIGSTTAALGGSVTSDGNSAVTERGVCFSVSQNPTTANSKLAIGTGTGAFSNTVSGLTGSTTYYARAYAINGKGTAYGSQISFTTNKLITIASLSTTAATSLTTNSAVVGGNITDDGGDAITERGVCYKISDSNGAAVITNTKVTIGTGTGLFSTTLTGLAANTIYSLRAYAYNSAGLAYGPEIKLTTLGSLATVTTKDVTNILETSAIAGGIVLTDEGSAVTERGICYGTSTNPTIYDTKIASGSGLGGFNIPLNSLIPNTTYYVRAYATNKNGTAYGENKTFKTADAYYAGFENGLPAGWSGMWTVSSNSPYEGFSCLRSFVVGDSIKVTLNITNPSGGQISFFHRYDVWGGRTEFYIDNVLQTTMADGAWTLHSFPVTTGTHKFKWLNEAGGGGVGNAIDYIIAPK